MTTLLREQGAEPLPGYRLIELLGSGGFGEVWKCEVPGALFKAIKFVYGNLNSLDNDAVRAEQEQSSLQRILKVNHPFILSIHRIDIIAGELIIVMDLADSSLHDRFEECQSQGLRGIPASQLWDYVRDAAEALDYMNQEHQLQHLDIKPRNLFLVSNRVKVADFGLVKSLQGSMSGLAAVTPLYAPPETLRGMVSPHSDQYSLAIVYTELLTGQRPFTGRNPRELAQQHLKEDPEIRMLPEGERPVVARALAKDPEKRFPSCLAFVRALLQARSPTRLLTRPPGASDGTKLRPTETMEDLKLEDPVWKSSSASGDSGEVAPVVYSANDVSQFGLTMAVPDKGALRPTLLIGVGGMGRHALLDLRCRFIDRFGDLDNVPLFRFLYIDTDADALRDAQRIGHELGFKNHEIYHLPLHQIGHYRRRQLDAMVADWLCREKVYSMPRSLKTQGSRALGRLAFCDNYQRLLTRLRRDLQQAAHPDAIYQTVNATGLAIRDSVPRIYVIGNATGGSSGFLPDLGYSLRHLFQVLKQPEAKATALLLCGSPDDPATPVGDQANLVATLTELNHFNDPSIAFTARYGDEREPLRLEGPPFDNTYLLTLAQRTRASRQEALAHLGSYLFHELTTPLGLRLERVRTCETPPDAAAFRTLGTFAVWFPRGLMLRLAAKFACSRLLEEWQAMGEVTASQELQAATARLMADPGLLPDTLMTQINQVAAQHMEGGAPADVLTRLVLDLEALVGAQDDLGFAAQQAMSKLNEWLGNGVQIPGGGLNTQNGRGGSGLALDHRKSRLTRSLEKAAEEVAEGWAKTLLETACGLMEHPGRRLAVAESFLSHFASTFSTASADLTQRLEQRRAQTLACEAYLEQALEVCVNSSGGFSWFGGRSRRALRVFMDHLAAFARQCLGDDLAAAVLLFFGHLRCRLGEHLRDLTICRQQVRNLQEQLTLPSGDFEDVNNTSSRLELTPHLSPAPSTESYWDSIRNSTTARVVLPENEETLEKAAQMFLKTLTFDHWQRLDQALQDQVLHPLKGLFHCCLGGIDVGKHLKPTLLNHATQALGTFLSITDVAEMELQQVEHEEGGLAGRVQDYHERAAPLIGVASLASSTSGPSTTFPTGLSGSKPLPSESRPEDYQHAFLLIPDSEAGKNFGIEAVKNLDGLHLVNSPGQADLMFCRERDYIRLEDLERLLQPCRPAYEKAVNLPATSPHARLDIQDWTPLNP